MYVCVSVTETVGGTGPRTTGGVAKGLATVGKGLATVGKGLATGGKMCVRAWE